MTDQLGHYSFQQDEPTLGELIAKNPESARMVIAKAKAHFESQAAGVHSGLKYDDAKPRTDLISSTAMLEIGRVLAYGAVKYGPNNWRKGISWGRLIGAVLRHVFAWMRGEDCDPESGLPHLSHAITTLMMLVEFEQTRRDLDDRWKFSKEEESK